MLDIITMHFINYSIIYHFLHIDRPQKVIMIPVLIRYAIQFHAWQQSSQIFDILYSGHIVIIAVIHVNATIDILHIV